MILLPFTNVVDLIWCLRLNARAYLIASANDKFCQNLLRSNWTPYNQEVFIVMYSVTDVESFNLAHETLKTLSRFIENDILSEKACPSSNGTSPTVELNDNTRNMTNGIGNGSTSSATVNGGTTTTTSGPLVYFVGNKADLSHIR